MAKDIIYPPLVSWKSLLNGIVGGSLIVGGLANAFGPVIQVILFLFGLFILIDGVMVTGKGVFIVLCLISAVIFGVITLVLSATSLGVPYLAGIFIIAFVLYIGKFLKPVRKLLYAKENEPEKPDKENQE